ncbi:hypothetical protein D3C81_2239120 [compost metagenome]
MADFSHTHGTLVRGGLPTDQFILQVDLNHFAHQAVGCAAYGGNLLQDRQTGFA